MKKNKVDVSRFDRTPCILGINFIGKVTVQYNSTLQHVGISRNNYNILRLQIIGIVLDHVLIMLILFIRVTRTVPLDPRVST